MNISKINSRPEGGFTLIELLVVISIIGLLSSIVLASLTTARNKGYDGAVKTGMEQLRTQNELYYHSNGFSYGTAGNSCATAGSVFASSSAIIASITKNDLGDPFCWNTSSAWAVTTAMKGGGNWCVDSLGASKLISSATSSTPICP